MEQDLALNILKMGRSVFLTGNAGTGKSYLLNQYIGYLKLNRVRFAVTASTGIAASHLKGVTIHSWSGMGVRDSLSLNDLVAIKKKKTEIAETAVLIIDEISMLHSKQFSMLDEILKYCRESTKPFGGIQLIVCGDFFQLPPVEKGVGSGAKKFCFMSPQWIEADFSVCYLTKQYRNNGDVLNDILNQIRADTFSEESSKLITATKDNFLGDGDVTKLYTHNADVDRINARHLDQLESKEYSHLYDVSGVKPLYEMLVKQNRIKEAFQYKIGALVMLTKNNEEKGYCNGSTGVITGVFKDDTHGIIPVVKLSSGAQIIVEPESWAVVEGDSEIASVVQLPLRLAWAITIHKSQGMTLDRVEMDLSGTFESGQAYVALSRLKSLSGMRVLGINEMISSIDTIVRKADFRFKELSLVNSAKFANEKKFGSLHKEFIKLCRDSGWVLKQGTNKDFKYAGKKNRGLSVRKKDVKSSLASSEDALEILLSQKDISHTTLIRNVQTWCAKDPSIDISKIRPDESTLGIVRSVIKSYRERGNVQPLYKNNALFIMQNVKMNGGSHLTEIDVWKSFLFLTDDGEMK